MDNRQRLLFLIICCALVSIPFLAVKFPPITDLPQHVGQVRVFQEALSDDQASPYKIQWLTPYSLVYSLLGACWALVGSENAGRLGMLVMVWMWIFLIQFLAHKEKRALAGAILATVLFFSHIMYLGLYQFALGWIVFVGWVFLTKSVRREGWKEFVVLAAYALVLYLTHVLWMLAAIAWLFFGDLFFRRNLNRMIRRLGSVIPVLVLVYFWYPSLSSYGFRSYTIWGTSPWERLSPIWLVNATLGGLKGSVEYMLFGVLAFWLAYAIWQNRKNLKTSVNKEFLLLFAGFFLLGLVLPDRHVNTVRFAQRWIPPAFSFLLLSMPTVKMGKNIIRVVMTLVITSFFLYTAISWKNFESVELSGLKASLEALPEKPRVIGLSYIKESPLIKGRPFIQIFAYSQVYKGGELNFSFADFGPSLVVYQEFRKKPWTRGLEWRPERARRKDFWFFDYAIINAPRTVHLEISTDPRLQPLTDEGTWRLYKVLDGSIENSGLIP